MSFEQRRFSFELGGSISASIAVISAIAFNSENRTPLENLACRYWYSAVFRTRPELVGVASPTARHAILIAPGRCTRGARYLSDRNATGKVVVGIETSALVLVNHFRSDLFSAVAV
jgi:hypothetical protein